MNVFIGLLVSITTVPIKPKCVVGISVPSNRTLNRAASQSDANEETIRLNKRSHLIVFIMDVLLNGLSISSKKRDTATVLHDGEKRCHFDATFWLLMVPD